MDDDTTPADHVSQEVAALSAAQEEAFSREAEEEFDILAEEIHTIAQESGPISIGFGNEKGGVGKTTLTTNLGYEFAKRGLKVLVLGLCQQVDFQERLGLHDTDEGWSLYVSLLGKGELEIHRDVRPNLDAIVGGKEVRMLDTLTGANQAMVPGGNVVEAFRAIMLEAFDPYDVVLIDFPPGNPMVQLMGLGVTDWVIVPMRTDMESIDAFESFSGMVNDARKSNPDLKYAGAVLFAVNPQATAMRREHEDEVHALETGIPIFQSSVRYAQKVGRDTRKRGMLAAELADEAIKNAPNKFKTLGDKDATTYSNATTKIADDFSNLALEILITITEKMK